MPIYEFHCDKCDNDSEILVRSSDWRGTKCPRCGSVRLTKKLSVFASTASSGTSAGEACCVGDGAACGADSSACGCCCGGGKHLH
ncbi:MAG: zinc ribbon domain-containing protein [Verrucomicrobiota bacterium]|jgi:putative FmdB family regulatory protein